LSIINSIREVIIKTIINKDANCFSFASAFNSDNPPTTKNKLSIHRLLEDNSIEFKKYLLCVGRDLAVEDNDTVFIAFLAKGVENCWKIIYISKRKIINTEVLYVNNSEQVFLLDPSKHNLINTWVSEELLKGILIDDFNFSENVFLTINTLIEPEKEPSGNLPNIYRHKNIIFTYDCRGSCIATPCDEDGLFDLPQQILNDAIPLLFTEGDSSEIAVLLTDSMYVDYGAYLLFFSTKKKKPDIYFCENYEDHDWKKLNQREVSRLPNNIKTLKNVFKQSVN